MEREALSSAWKQVALFAVTLGLPLAFAGYAVLKLPSRHAGAADDLWAFAIVGLVGVLLAVALALMALRRSMDISPERISIKHSFYTFNLDKSAVTSLAVRELNSVDELNLSWRKNGVAIFGYYSGWFFNAYNQKLFCAISTKPMFELAIEGNGLPCKRIAVSCSPETAQHLRAWCPGNQSA